jgi:HK97 family phage portal protein
MVWPFKSKAREEQRAITSIEGYWPDIADSNTMGQVSVSRALSLVPVFAAVRLIADSIASLPPVLYKKDSNGLAKRQPTPPLFQNPSIHGTLYDWLHRGVTSQALNGDAIGLITAKDYYNKPTMVEWLNPEQVATQDGKLTGPGSYMNPSWWWYGRPIDKSELVHIPWFTMPYRVRGLSPVGAFQLTANTGIGAQEFAANWFQHGGVPPGTFRNSERTIDPKDADLLTQRLVNRMQSRKPLVYGKDWEYNPIAIKPHEAEFIETMRLTATHIAVIYGLPPEMIGGSMGESLTYSTVEQNALKYKTFSLRPWLVRWEYALTNLFAKPYFVKFDTSELDRVDAETRAKIDQMSLGYNPSPWKEVDEVRATYDLGPMPKPQPEAIPVIPVPANGQAQPMMRERVTNGNTPHGKMSNSGTVLSGANSAAGKGN